MDEDTERMMQALFLVVAIGMAVALVAAAALRVA